MEGRDVGREGSEARREARYCDRLVEGRGSGGRDQGCMGLCNEKCCPKGRAGRDGWREGTEWKYEEERGNWEEWRLGDGWWRGGVNL